MSRLDTEARMAVKVLTARGSSKSEIARLLDVTEGSVRYHLRRMQAGTPDGRSLQTFKATALCEVIDVWRSRQGERINLAALHIWLCDEYGYDGSLKSIQRYCKKAYPAPAIRARRRVETPPGAQAQVDWAHFPGVVIDNAPVDLRALHMVLSWSRKQAIVWSTSKDMLSWLGCHTACFTRLGGVPATLRVDNEKTAVAQGAGAWGVVNKTYRRYGETLCFHVDACAPRQPQQKGKVERRVRDQRMAINPHSRMFADLSELQAWTDARVEACPGQSDRGTGRGADAAGDRRLPAQLHAALLRCLSPAAG
jgi:transposase